MVWQPGIPSYFSPLGHVTMQSRHCDVPYQSTLCFLRKTMTEANRRREPGTREKVHSRRINLEGNTHAQESNASQLPV
jgi:hypothetical protein